MEARFDPSSRSKLTPRDLGRFVGETLFDRIGRAVCRAECLPRKELYEAWEVARRVRRRHRGGRVLDSACGHGLLAHLMLLLDDSSPRAMAIDTRIPASATTLKAAFTSEWPRLGDRISLIEAPLESIEIEASDLAVSVHACGALTDLVIDRAIAARCTVAVLPCCHDAASSDLGGLGGWLEPSLAIDATRVARLRQHDFEVRTQHIPSEITPKNRLLVGSPR